MKLPKNQSGIAHIAIILIIIIVPILGFAGWRVYSANPKIKPAATSTPAPSAQQNQEAKTKKDTLPSDFILYTNAKFSYSFGYPSSYQLLDLTAYGTDIAQAFHLRLFNTKEKPEKVQSTDMVLDIVMDLSPSTTSGHKDAALLTDLVLKDIKTIAEASHRINKEDKNPNVAKLVGELKETKVGDNQAYYFSVSGSFSTDYVSDSGSGFVLDVPVNVYFVKNKNNNVFRIMDYKKDSTNKVILDNFTFTR